MKDGARADLAIGAKRGVLELGGRVDGGRDGQRLAAHAFLLGLEMRSPGSSDARTTM
jgi:hypothetical protein